MERMEWPERPRGVNNYAGVQPLPQRCLRAELSPKDMHAKGPNGANTGECFQLDKRGPNETQPVLPTLFMPGFPKCASTWLFECMHSAFVPEVVCDEFEKPGQRRLPLAATRMMRRAFQSPRPFDPYRWSREGCGGRRYMLPGIACAVTGGCSHRKVRPLTDTHVLQPRLCRLAAHQPCTLADLSLRTAVSRAAGH